MNIIVTNGIQLLQYNKTIMHSYGFITQNSCILVKKNYSVRVFNWCIYFHVFYVTYIKLNVYILYILIIYELLYYYYGSFCENIV